MWGWLSAFAGMKLSDIYLRGLTADNGRRQLNRIQGSFAGTIDNFTRALVHSQERRLDEVSCKGLCVNVLARIKRYCEYALEPGGENRLRVTLAVPIRELGSGRVLYLQVWCYDEPYPDRRWSVLPLGGPGAPAAFQSGTFKLIDDIWQEESVSDRRTREFRSVMCIPVKAGGPNGESLAVVNVDSPVPNFFDADSVDRVLALLAPAVNIIALEILTRAEGARYAFHN